MSTFLVPERPATEIASVLSQTCIADLKPADLAAPTAEVVCSLYSNFLSYVDPLGDDPDSQIGFAALDLLDNPDNHMDAIRIFNLYRKMKDMLTSIQYKNFTLRDLLRPEPKRTLHVLSAIINFLYHREEKLNLLQPIVDEFPGYEERTMELEAKIAELNKEIMDHEVACQLEEPMVKEVDAEVRKLKQMIQNYNKQQVTLKTDAKGLREKIDKIKGQISEADFELVKNAQENSSLLSKIVQSPDRLQRTLEEKKAYREEVKNSERLAMQNVQKKSAIMEVYSKAYEKVSKHFSLMQVIQEQVNSAKGVDKDVKNYKTKLSEEGVSKMSLEAKIDEWQGKAIQIEELMKAMENERNAMLTQDTEKLDTLRTELEAKLQGLEPRERIVEAMVAKGDELCSEAKLVREAGKARQHDMQAKLEKIVDAFYSYSDEVDEALQSDFLSPRDRVPTFPSRGVGDN